MARLKAAPFQDEVKLEVVCSLLGDAAQGKDSNAAGLASQRLKLALILRTAPLKRCPDTEPCALEYSLVVKTALPAASGPTPCARKDGAPAVETVYAEKPWVVRLGDFTPRTLLFEQCYLPLVLGAVAWAAGGADYCKDCQRLESGARDEDALGV
jgi:hypothetical protein